MKDAAIAIDSLRALERIQKKLDRWELEHLRAHARHLADRIEEVEEANAELRDRLTSAEDRAEWWREQCMHITEHLGKETVVGMTKDGELHLMKQEAA
jgi:DNA repair exonuclease SbcCD ATPase subunit